MSKTYHRKPNWDDDYGDYDDNHNKHNHRKNHRHFRKNRQPEDEYNPDENGGPNNGDYHGYKDFEKNRR